MKSLSRLALVTLCIVLLVGLSASRTQAQTGVTARVVCAQYVRQGPYNESARIGLLEGQPEVLNVYAVNERRLWADNGIWVVVEQPSTGLRGWMYNGDCLAITGSLNTLPEVREPDLQGPPLASIVCDQYFRSRPDEEAAAVAILFAGEPSLRILGRDEVAQWIYVERYTGQRGWLFNGRCIATEGNVLGTPYLDEVYVGPLVANVVCTQYARLEPNNDALELMILYPHDGTLAIAGRDVYANWFLIVTGDGRIGWVFNGDCLVIRGEPTDARYPPPAAVNGIAIAPAELGGNVPQVSAPVTIAGIPGSGGYFPVGDGVVPPVMPGLIPVQPDAQTLGGAGVPAQPPQAEAPAAAGVGGPGQTINVDVNCDQTGQPVIRNGSAVTLMLEWRTTDVAYANDWLDAQRSQAYLNGEQITDLFAGLTSAPQDTGGGQWVAGYYYPVGVLGPGTYWVHWDMTLTRDITTNGTDTRFAGGYVFSCMFSVQ